LYISPNAPLAILFPNFISLISTSKLLKNVLYLDNSFFTFDICSLFVLSLELVYPIESKLID